MSGIIEKYNREREALNELTAESLAAAMRMLDDKNIGYVNIERMLIIKYALECYAKSVDEKTLNLFGIEINKSGVAKWKD